MIKIEHIKGLGTYWFFELFDVSERDRDEITFDIQHVINEFNDTYSRFRDDSLVGTLNKKGVVYEPTPEFISLLHKGLALYDQSGGVFNMVTGHVQEAHGYDAEYSFSEREGSYEIQSPRSVLDITEKKVMLSSGRVDFGGFGKGCLIDLLAEFLHTRGCKEFLINGGGDMYATERGGAPIEVHLEHPTKPKTYVANVPLFNAALGCSSSYLRSWETKNSGTKRSHLIDPNDPDRLLQAASFVITNAAADADAWATIACLLSAEEFHERFRGGGDYLVLDADGGAWMSQNFNNYILN